MSKNLFLTQNLNWKSDSLFKNININMNMENGTIEPLLDGTKILNICKSNCEIFDKYEQKECLQYCKNYTDSFFMSNDFAKKKCPNGDHYCCKKESKDNDFAYFICTNRKNFNNIENRKNFKLPEYVIPLIVFLTLVILFFFIFFLIK